MLGACGRTLIAGCHVWRRITRIKKGGERGGEVEGRREVGGAEVAAPIVVVVILEDWRREGSGGVEKKKLQLIASRVPGLNAFQTPPFLLFFTGYT